MKQNKEKISPWKTRFGLLLVLVLMVIHYTFKWFGKLQGAEFYAILMLLLLGVFVLLFVNIKAVGDSIGSLIGRIKKIESSGQSIHLDTKIEGTPSEASNPQKIIKKDALGSKDSSGENYATKDLASLEALAKNNDPKAQLYLGNRYCFGEGVEQDYQKGVGWYKKSAEKEDAVAQNNLGVCYNKGYGVKQNYQEAVKWYRKSAEQGNASAQYCLGVCYDKGEGVKQDDQEAVGWYKKSAKEGIADAQYNLGVCYYNGQGVLKSWVLAHMWLNLSGDGGKFLKDLEKKMTKEQVTDAHDRALRWTDKKEKEGAEKS